MEENINNCLEDKLDDVGHLLLKVKCLARLCALASDSCIDDKELLLQDNLAFFFALKSIVNLIIQIEDILETCP